MEYSKKRRLDPSMERQEIVRSMIRILNQKQIQPVRIIEKEHLVIHVFIDIQEEDAFLEIRKDIYKKIQEEIDITIFSVFLKNDDEYWGDDEEDTDVTRKFLNPDTSINNCEDVKHLFEKIPCFDINKELVNQHIDCQEDLALSMKNNFANFRWKIKGKGKSLDAFIDNINNEQSVSHNTKCIQQNTECLVA